MVKQTLYINTKDGYDDIKTKLDMKKDYFIQLVYFAYQIIDKFGEEEALNGEQTEFETTFTVTNELDEDGEESMSVSMEPEISGKDLINASVVILKIMEALMEDNE